MNNTKENVSCQSRNDNHYETIADEKQVLQLFWDFKQWFNHVFYVQITRKKQS